MRNKKSQIITLLVSAISIAGCMFAIKPSQIKNGLANKNEKNTISSNFKFDFETYNVDKTKIFTNEAKSTSTIMVEKKQCARIAGLENIEISYSFKNSLNNSQSNSISFSIISKDKLSFDSNTTKNALESRIEAINKTIESKKISSSVLPNILDTLTECQTQLRNDTFSIQLVNKYGFEGIYGENYGGLDDVGSPDRYLSVKKNNIWFVIKDAGFLDYQLFRDKTLKCLGDKIYNQYADSPIDFSKVSEKNVLNCQKKVWNSLNNESMTQQWIDEVLKSITYTPTSN